LNMTDPQNRIQIQAAGVIEGFRNDLQALCRSLESAGLWRPSAALKTQCLRSVERIDQTGRRFDRKLTVSIIGACGSGKSTLLNALAGVDDLSETGIHRPTTESLIVFCKDRSDADFISGFPEAGSVRIRTSQAAAALSGVILVDTPDIDSIHEKDHVALVSRAIELSDILICVFNAENPRRRDTVDFFQPFVQQFSGESLIVVINKCDRLDETELKERILPEFSDYIHNAWEKPVSRIFCTSARSRLKDPAWEPDAGPRHGFDEFDPLHNMIFGAFNQGGFVVDRRIENARSLRDAAFEAVRVQAEKDVPVLDKVGGEIQKVRDEALRAALMEIQRDRGRHPAVNLMLYQRLSQRWLGPVGWMIAVWSRILLFGTGIASMLRFGNPLRQAWGAISSFVHYRDSSRTLESMQSGRRIDLAFRAYRTAVNRKWPDIADALTAARFDPQITETGNVLPEENAFGEEMDQLWKEALEDAVESASVRLSGVFSQILFNLPVMAILCHAGWITVREYFSSNYLSSAFFLHAFLTFGIVLLLSFFLFQARVRMGAGGERILRSAFEALERMCDQKMDAQSFDPVEKQVRAVLDLARTSPSE